MPPTRWRRLKEKADVVSLLDDSDSDGEPLLLDDSDSDGDGKELVWLDDSDDDRLDDWTLKEETYVQQVDTWEPGAVQCKRRRVTVESGPRSNPADAHSAWLFRVPSVLIPILLLLDSYTFCLDSLEIFAGCASATAALRASGLACAVYDLNLGESPCYDITTSRGLAWRFN